jgi:hypothetical protein
MSRNVYESQLLIHKATKAGCEVWGDGGGGGARVNANTNSTVNSNVNREVRSTPLSGCHCGAICASADLLFLPRAAFSLLVRLCFGLAVALAVPSFAVGLPFWFAFRINFGINV